MEGYQILFDGTMNTVWSAPNYCYRYENMASILEIDEHYNTQFNIFSGSPENLEKKVIEHHMLDEFADSFDENN